MAAPALARKLRTFDYFTLAFGTMIGAGWLVLMDDWLERGGPAGAMLGFAIGGLLLVPVAYVYAKLVALIPDEGTEIAYTTHAFNQQAGFYTGWIMLLAYVIVCPWEALAIGKIAAWFFPALDTIPLYQIGGKAVYLPHVVLGLALTVTLTWVNYRGIRHSSVFQNWTTLGFLALLIAATGASLPRGSFANFHPAFHHGVVTSVLLVLQIVPYFMVGFESVPKCAEESMPGFPTRKLSQAIFLALGVGAAFYVGIIAVVGYIAPWHDLLSRRFATATAFDMATAGSFLVKFVFASALISLMKVFNGNFVAGSRLLFAMGRRGLVNPRVGAIHAQNRTPYMAVLGVGVFTAATFLLGDTLLVSVTEVGSLAAGAGWFAASAAYLKLAERAGQRVIATMGCVVGLSLVLLKLLPWVPGHFTWAEFLAFAIWMLLGIALKSRGAQRAAAEGTS